MDKRKEKEERRVIIWTRKYIKRFLSRKLFLVFLIILPLGTFFFSYFVRRDSASVKVGIVMESDTPFLKELRDSFVGQRDVLQFDMLRSQEEIKEKIREGALACGYFFPKDMKEKYDSRQYSGVVKQYYREGDSFHALAGEIVMARIFRQYGKNMLEDYVRNSGMFYTERISDKEIEQKYRENMEIQNTFSLSVNRNSRVKKNWGDYLVAPIRGIVSLLIMMAGFCGVSLFLEDCRKEIPAAVRGSISRRLSLISIAVPVLILSVAALFSEALCGVGYLTIKEIAYMFVYDIMIVLFCNVLSGLNVKESILWMGALVYVCASAMLTPVFVNLTVFLPGVKILSYLCLPYYYLNTVFGGRQELLLMVLVSGMLFAVNVLLIRRR